MISIVVNYKIPGNNISTIVGLEVKGHANSAPHGQDLVCAAVSAVVVGGANAIMEQVNKNYHPDVNISLKEGHALFELSGTYTQESNKVQNTMKTILIMLKTIQESNPDFVKIKEK